MSQIEKIPKGLQHWLALTGIVLVPFLANLGDLLAGRIPWFMDTVTQFYPFRFHAAQLLWRGELPFWNRTIFAGVPLLADPQWGLMYPGHWLFLLMPGPRTFTLINAMHVALLGAGIFVWVRMMNRDRLFGAIVAALIGQLGGWTWAHYAFGAYLQVAAWMPVMLLCYEQYQKAPKAKWLICGGVAGAFQILAGAPQLAVYCQMGLWVYAIVSAAMRGRRALMRAVYFLGGQALLTLGFSAPQWAITQRFLAECERSGGLSLEAVRRGTISLREIWQAWAGGRGPADAELILYPGWCVIGAVIAGAVFLGWMILARIKQRNLNEGKAEGDLIAIVAGGAAAVAMGCVTAWSSAAPLLYKFLPLYSKFHDPKRILFISFFFAVLLTGVILQQALAKMGTSRLYMGLIYLVVAASLSDMGGFVRRWIDTKSVAVEQFMLKDVKRETGIAQGESYFAQDMGIQYSYNYTRSNFAGTLLPNLSSMYGLEDVQGYNPFIPWRYAVYMRRLNSAPAPSVTLYPSHFGLVRNPDSPWLQYFAELKARGAVDHYWPFFPPTWISPNENVQVPLGRLMRIGNSLKVNIASMEDFAGESVNARLELIAIAGQEQKKVMQLSGKRPADAEIIWPDVLPSPGRTTPVFEATIAGSGEAVEADRLVIVNRGILPVLVYSIGIPRPIMVFAAEGTTGTFLSMWKSKSRPVQLHQMGDVRPESREDYEKWAMGLSPDAVHVEIGLDEPESNAPLWTIEGWKISEKRNAYLKVELPKGHGAGWAMLPESYAPGWKCKVDGIPARICPANSLFRAVAVGENAQVLEMMYQPPGLAMGIGVFLLTIILSALIMLREWSQHRKIQPNKDNSEIIWM